MEILLAFLILGIVVTTVLASFNAVFSTTDTLNNSSRYYDMAKNCLNRMTLDLEALYVRQPPLYKKPEFDDPPDPYRIAGSTTDFGGTSFAQLDSPAVPISLWKKATGTELLKLFIM